MHFCVIVALASTLGLLRFSKVSASIKNHDTFKMYQYRDTFWWMYQVSLSWYNCEPSISISITIQFKSIIPNTGVKLL